MDTPKIKISTDLFDMKAGGRGDIHTSYFQSQGVNEIFHHRKVSLLRNHDKQPSSLLIILNTCIRSAKKYIIKKIAINYLQARYLS